MGEVTERADHLHPPQPRLTVRVGVVGHRPNKLVAPSIEQIELQLKKVFAAIDTAARELLASGDCCFAVQAPRVRLVSGFAEGADRLAVGACPAGWEIEAILPFPKDAYMQSLITRDANAVNTRESFDAALKKAKTVTELSLPQDGSQEAEDVGGKIRHMQKGYANAGSYFLRQIDVLIAIWDGKPPRVAGTGAIARHAFDGGIPVVWIKTDDETNHATKGEHSARNTRARSIDKIPRLIVRFHENGNPEAPETDCTNGSLAEALQQIFALPSNVARASRKSPRARLNEFYEEGWRSFTLWCAYDALKRLANLQRPRFAIGITPFDKRCNEWDRFIASAPAATDLTAQLRKLLLPRYVWADALAVYFSHHYRSAYVLAYLLSASAVFVALAGLLWPDSKIWFTVAELGVISLIIGLIFFGRIQRWHERWLEYRALAESLRYSRFLAFVGEFGHVQDRPAGSDSPWVLWYLRATMREIGLPTALIDGAYQWRLLNATLTDEIRGQFDYHHANSLSAHKVDRMLHGLGMLCFGITFLILMTFVLGYFYMVWTGTVADEASWPPWIHWLKLHMIVVSAGLPALGAALAGIRVHADFEGSKGRSDVMRNTLKVLELDYQRAMTQTINLDDTARLVLGAAREMSEDVHAFQELHGRKRLVLPG
jgi:hypothetical protein